MISGIGGVRRTASFADLAGIGALEDTGSGSGCEFNTIVIVGALGRGGIT